MFFEILTIIIAMIIIVGVTLVMLSRYDSLLTVNGAMLTTFGLTVLFWTARGNVSYIRESSAVRWLYKPLADLPEWVGYTGLAVTAGLLVASIAFLVDDFVHLPRRKGGNR